MSTGAWVSVWVLLVVAALVFYVLIGLHLYGKVKTVLGQAQESLEVFDSFTEAMAAAEEAPFNTPVALGADAARRAQWRHTRRVNRIRRRQRRARRHRQTLERWKNVPLTAPKA